MARTVQHPTPAPRPPDLAVSDLSDPAGRAALTPAATKAILRLAGIWQVSAADMAALLGGISDRTWYRMKTVAPEALGQDLLTRISALVGIYKGLTLLFSEPLASEWVNRPNSNRLFAGRTPLAAMIRGGIPKMLQVRAYIDALRGGL